MGRMDARVLPRRWLPGVGGIAALLVVTAAALPGAGGSAHASSWRAAMAPGEVAAVHKDVEASCDSCHLPFAGLPNEKCLACHEGIAARVDTGRGYHGSVAKQPCIDCHGDHAGRDASMTTAAARRAFSHPVTGFSLGGGHQSVSCADCHTGPIEEIRADCIACHDGGHGGHDGALGRDCAACHTSLGWTVDLKPLDAHAIPMNGAHGTLSCAGCHGLGANLRLEQAECSDCHAQAHGGSEAACQECHGTTAWKPALFDHDKCPCAFPGKHKTVECVSCHAEMNFTATPTVCSECHAKDRPHQPLGECSTCHSALSWQQGRFDHNRQTGFRLDGKHLAVSCNSCHGDSGNFRDAPADCAGCHGDAGTTAHGTSPEFRDCTACHSTSGFGPGGFDHVSTGFALSGAHAAANCADCHDGRVEGYDVTRDELSAQGGAPDLSGAAPVACMHCHEDAHDGSVGPDCASCHGATEWREHRVDLARHEASAFPLRGQHTETACSLCHTEGTLRPLPVRCSDCHVDRHDGLLGQGCADCHTEESFTQVAAFDHASTGFALLGQHDGLECTACHEGENGRTLASRNLSESIRAGITATKEGADGIGAGTQAAAALTPLRSFVAALTGSLGLEESGSAEGASRVAGDPGKDASAVSCALCHEAGHGEQFGNECSACHDPAHESFAAASMPEDFDHDVTGFPLNRRHKALQCVQCHAKDGPPAIGRCASCHVDPHGGQLGMECADCHAEDRFRLARFDHDRTGWPLRGRHFLAPCASCHVNQRWVGVPTDCWGCHALDAGRARSNPAIGGHPFGPTDCRDCHRGLWRFSVP